MKDLDAIIEELKNEALDVTEEGWLSDLSSERLEWDEGNQAIVIGDWIGSIDVGHLSGIVESLISDATKDLITRLENQTSVVKTLAERNVELTKRKNELNQKLEQAERDLVVVRESQKKIAKQFAAMGTEKGKAEWRAREAEAAVARVREVADNARATKHESTEYLHPLKILRALDGHTKQLGGTPTGEFAYVCSCGKSYWPCTALDGGQDV